MILSRSIVLVALATVAPHSTAGVEVVGNGFFPFKGSAAKADRDSLVMIDKNNSPNDPLYECFEDVTRNSRKKKRLSSAKLTALRRQLLEGLQVLVSLPP